MVNLLCTVNRKLYFFSDFLVPFAQKDYDDDSNSHQRFRIKSYFKSLIISTNKKGARV